MKTRLLLLTACLLVALSAAAQTNSQQTVNVLAATIDSAPVSTINVHELSVEWTFGTVTGSYTTCTVQPKTTLDGTTYLTLGSAFTVTVSTNRVNAFTVTEPLAATVSATAANSFGLNALLTFACSGYGTSAPVALSIVPQASPTSAILAAGSSVIGHVIADTGSTTAVTQATGTNLHAVLDTTSTTAVTQATGTNLHSVVDSGTITAVTAITNALPAGANVIGHVIADTGSTTAVTQATGTNLHAVLDTTSTTAVTQATGTNLHAVIDSGSTTAVTALPATPAGTNVIGTVRNTTAMTGYTTDYDSGVVVVANGAAAAVTTAVVKIDHLRCWNITGGAVTVTITDTAGNNIVPPAFSIPTLTIEPFLESATGEVWTGIKMGAGAGASINCYVRGKQ